MSADAAGDLASERLTLEPLRPDHTDEMVSVLSDTDLYEFTGGVPPSRDELAERYRRQVEGSGRDDEQWFNWIVRRNDTAKAIGYVQATVTGDRAELAWLIGVDHQRLGFAQEASEAISARPVYRWSRPMWRLVTLARNASRRVSDWNEPARSTKTVRRFGSEYRTDPSCRGSRSTSDSHESVRGRIWLTERGRPARINHAT